MIQPAYARSLLLLAITSLLTVLSPCAASKESPADLAECIKVLKQALPTDTLNKLKSGPESAVSDFHFSVGLSIRNSWIRGKHESPLVKSFAKMGLTNPDDISSVILISLWRDLHSQPWNVDAQLKEINGYNFYNGPEVRLKRPVPEKMWNQELVTSAGKKIHLREYKNKVFVLMITWVDYHSIDAMRQLKSWRAQFARADFDGVAIVSLADNAKVLGLINATKADFPVILDQNFVSEVVRPALIAPGGLELPTTILIGKDGNTITRLQSWYPDYPGKLTAEIVKAVGKDTSVRAGKKPD